MPEMFNARFPGRCAGDCDGIRPGDLVRYNDDDELQHPGCTAHVDAHGLTARERVCGACQLAHAGECP